MDIKNTHTYQFLRAKDVDLNEILGGNYRETISAQTARGLRQRKQITGQQKSMDMAHGNMLLGGAGIVGGASLLKKNPLLGGLLMLAGAVVAGTTIADWKNGKM